MFVVLIFVIFKMFFEFVFVNGLVVFVVLFLRFIGWIRIFFVMVFYVFDFWFVESIVKNWWVYGLMWWEFVFWKVDEVFIVYVNRFWLNVWGFFIIVEVLFVYIVFLFGFGFSVVYGIVIVCIFWLLNYLGVVDINNFNGLKVGIVDFYVVWSEVVVLVVREVLLYGFCWLLVCWRFVVLIFIVLLSVFDSIMGCGVYR